MSMKSRAELLRALYEGILIDAAHRFPESMLTFERDKTRIQKIIDRNEIWFFTIQLPAWSKHLMRCLDEGSVQPFEGAHSATLSLIHI